jgi:hypothetical protein
MPRAPQNRACGINRIRLKQITDSTASVAVCLLMTIQVYQGQIVIAIVATFTLLLFVMNV